MSTDSAKNGIHLESTLVNAGSVPGVRDCRANLVPAEPRQADPSGISLIGPLPDTEEPNEEEIAPHLTVRRTVGEGGVGRVLLGFDKRIKREVAVKELLPAARQDPHVRARFLREAQITARLEHPGVVPVHEMGQRPDGRPYYVMKYVRGQTLSQALEDCGRAGPGGALHQRLTLLDALIDVCQAMAYAHTEGIVHRDLKPSNIIIGPFGETIILDWGLAKLEADADLTQECSVLDRFRQEAVVEAQLTHAGEVLGTPAYMAPEQVDPAWGIVGRRSDVFALGCILFHILAGRPPLSGQASLEELLETLASRTPMPTVRDRVPEVPSELAAICDHALAKDPGRRFADAGEMAAQLEAYRDGRLVTVHAYSAGDLLRRFVSRNRIPLAAGVVALVAIVAGAVFSVWFGLDAHQARLEAETAQARAEAALVEITDASTRNLTLAGQATTTIERAIEELAESLSVIADQIAESGMEQRAFIAAALRRLVADYPYLLKVVVLSPDGTIVGVVPDALAETLGTDVSHLTHVQWTLEHRIRNFSPLFTTIEGETAVTLHMPIMRDNTLLAVLSAVIDPIALGHAVLPEAQQRIWLMQGDGVILYSLDERDVGRDLFSDSFYADHPEMRHFGREMQKEAEGLGHYQYYDDSGLLTHWIAAWKTFHASYLAEWKVIAAEPYRDSIAVDH